MRIAKIVEQSTTLTACNVCRKETEHTWDSLPISIEFIKNKHFEEDYSESIWYDYCSIEHLFQDEKLLKEDPDNYDRVEVYVEEKGKELFIFLQRALKDRAE